MKRKTCFIVTLALCLLLLCSAGALADAPTEFTVGGVDMLAEGAIPPAGVAYDPATNTLTLTNVKLTQGTEGSYPGDDKVYYDCIYSNAHLNVVLVGDNTIDLSQAGYEFTYGLSAEETLTIGGSGSLTITGCDFGIHTGGDTVINGGEYIIKADSYAFFNYADCTTINGGLLTSIGCEFGFNFCDLVVSGGSLIASGGKYGILACNMIVTGGSLLLEGSQGGLVLANYNTTAEEAQSGYGLSFGLNTKIAVGGQLYSEGLVNSYSFETKDEDGQPITKTWYYTVGAVAQGEVQFVHDGEGNFTLTGGAKEVKIVSSEFSDVLAADYFFDGVSYVTAAGLMNGVGNGLFAPAGQMTRGMLVTVLWRMAGSPDTYADKAPEDIGSYGKAAVGWAYDTGVITGYGDGALRLDQAISREQLAAFLYRYEQAQGGGFSEGWEYELDFADAEAISDYAYEAMAWCVKNGILNGVGNDMLSPGGFATRGQMATMLQRYAAVERPEAAE